MSFSSYVDKNTSIIDVHYKSWNTWLTSKTYILSAGLTGPQQQASPDSTSPGATDVTESGSRSLLLSTPPDSELLKSEQELEEELEEDQDDDQSRQQTPTSGHKKRKRRVLFSKVSRALYLLNVLSGNKSDLIGIESQISILYCDVYGN